MGIDPVERVRELADAQRRSAYELLAAVRAAREEGVTWRELAAAAGATHHAWLYRQAEAGLPVSVLRAQAQPGVDHQPHSSSAGRKSHH